MRTILFEQLIQDKPQLGTPIPSDPENQLSTITQAPLLSLKPSLKIQDGDAYFQLQINEG